MSICVYLSKELLVYLYRGSVCLPGRAASWSFVLMTATLACASFAHQGLLAIIYLAKKDPICFDLGKAGAVQMFVTMWPQWEDDEMRQLLLWAMNEVARIGM